MDLRSSGRVASFFNHWSISAPYVLIFVFYLISLAKTRELYKSYVDNFCSMFLSHSLLMLPFVCSLKWADTVISDGLGRAKFNDILYLLLLIICYWLFILLLLLAIYLINSLIQKQVCDYHVYTEQKKMESAQISVNRWTDKWKCGTHIQ